MNTINSNLGFIIFFAFIVWVFIANDFYLKLFFLKEIRKNVEINHKKILIMSFLNRLMLGEMYLNILRMLF